MSPSLQLLQASVDEDDESYFRFLSESKYVKYVTVAAGLYTVEDMCFGPTLISILPQFPGGFWNLGCVVKYHETGQPYFSRTVSKQLKGVSNLWHPTKIDHLDLRMGKKLRSGVYEATSERIPKTAIVVKFARFEWEIDTIDHECSAYEWIEGHGIGPKFLGYMTEEGRAIGFMMEKVTNARHATTADHDACSQALLNLQELGILHGDVNKHNFLISPAGVTLIDFDVARKSDEGDLLRSEAQSLMHHLGDTSGRGGSVMT